MGKMCLAGCRDSVEEITAVWPGVVGHVPGPCLQGQVLQAVGQCCKCLSFLFLASV